MNFPTQDQVLASGRHVVTFASGGVTMFAALHLITGGDATSAANALNQIGHGFSEIVAGGGTLIAIGSGLFAAFSASPLLQLLKGAKAVSNDPSLAKGATVAQQATVATAIEALPNVQAVIASDDVAKASTSSSVLSTTDNRVISK
jgi:hypothetical protein